MRFMTYQQIWHNNKPSKWENPQMCIFYTPAGYKKRKIEKK